MTKLKIGITLGWSIPTGDAAMARGWKKYLLRRDDVESVHIIMPEDPMPDKLDFCIAFQHWNQLHPARMSTTCKMRGAISSYRIPWGVRVCLAIPWRFFMSSRTGSRTTYSQQKDSAKRLRSGGCQSSLSGCDCGLFSVCADERFAHPCVFVGSDIRGAEANDRYLAPALPHRLVIYGNQGWSSPSLAARWRGRLSDEDLPKVYSSATVVLDYAIPERKKYGLVNQLRDSTRCFGVWGRRADVIHTEGAQIQGCSPAPLCTNRTDSGDIYLGEFIRNPNPRDKADLDQRRDWVLQNGTFAKRMETLMAWLKEM